MKRAVFLFILILALTLGLSAQAESAEAYVPGTWVLTTVEESGVTISASRIGMYASYQLNADHTVVIKESERDPGVCGTWTIESRELQQRELAWGHYLILKDEGDPVELQFNPDGTLSYTRRGTTLIFAHQDGKSGQLAYDALKAFEPVEMVEGDYTIYAYPDKTCTIKLYSGSESEIVVPQTLAGCRVTRIRSGAFTDMGAFFGRPPRRDLTVHRRIVIPEGVYEIGDYAFAGLMGLEEIVLPDTIRTMGAACLSYTALKHVTLPAQLQEVPDGLLTACTALESVVLPQGIWRIGEDAFEECTSLREITIPGSAALIGECAFWGCTALTRVTLMEGVAEIDGAAFGDCTALTEITFPASLTEIVRYPNAFEGCDAIARVYAPENAYAREIAWVEETAGEYTISVFADGTCTIMAYSGATGDLVLPAELNGHRVTMIGERVFYEADGLTSVVVPEGVTRLCGSSFSSCEDLTSVQLPMSLTEISDHAFSSCSRLEAIHIPDGVVTIGRGAFGSCSALREVRLPEGLTVIEAAAFYACGSLQRIVIPEGVTMLGNSAFSNNPGLLEVSLPQSLTFIDLGAFLGCRDLTLTVTEGSYAHQYAVEEGIAFTLR